MKVRTLGSSSSGNSTWVMGDDTMILIDAGLKLREMQQKFEAMGVSLSSLNGILITHEHIDHVRSAGSIARKYGVPIYVHASGMDKTIKKLGKVNPDLIIAIYNEPFCVGEFTITAFDLPHDASMCVGYSIKKDDKKFSIATDFGQASPEIVKHLHNSKLVILESNHDEKMLVANPNYSALLKSRILSKNGHLSNMNAAKVICQLSENNVKRVVLAHLSEENNKPELALDTIKNYLTAIDKQMGKDIVVEVADPYLIGPVYHIT